MDMALWERDLQAQVYMAEEFSLNSLKNKKDKHEDYLSRNCKTLYSHHKDVW